MRAQATEASSQSGFEAGLVAALEPIRGFCLAAATAQLFSSGLFDLMRERGARPLADLARAIDAEPARLEGLLDYLSVEGLVAREHGTVELTARALELAPYAPWYTLLIGGYGRTFLDLESALPAGAPPAGRELTSVGIGSCGISRHDAIPLTRGLLEGVPEAGRAVLDIGCGSGRYLIDLCAAMPDGRFCGIEPDAGAAAAGRADIDAAGLGDRATILDGDAASALGAPLPFEPSCIVMGFVAHEILGQQGEDGLRGYLHRLADRFPHAHLAVIEVDDRLGDGAAMRHPLARAYYGPYFLLHPFTGQRLMRRDWWKEQFAGVGFELLDERSAPAEADSTGFEFGLLLGPRR